MSILRRIVGYLAVALLVLVSSVAVMPAAQASGETVAVGMPFDGKWAYNVPASSPYNDNINDSHPAAHETYGANWATDLYAADGTDVKAYGFASSGTLSLTVSSVTNTSCGAGKRVGITYKVNGVAIGTVSYEHLDTTITTGTSVSNGDVIGKTKWWGNLSCYVVPNTSGTHIHISFTNTSNYSCYVDLGQPGATTVAYGTPVGMLGSTNNGAQQACGSIPTPAGPSDLVGNTTNGTSLSFAGHWATGGSGQEMAYITKSSDGGFALAVHKQTPTGIVWAGVYWSQAGSSGVTYGNTVFIPGDANGDGLTDMYYATSTDWASNGFAVGLMLNTGSSLVWAGTKWAPTNLKLGQTRFVSGDWTGSGRDGFAYITPTSDNGFTVAVMAPSAGDLRLDWQGNKWTQYGSSGVQYANTKFMANDMDGNGIADLYYITSQNWDQNGFAMGLQYNNGSTFTWAGTKWAPTNLKLSQIRFLPGRWTGSSNEGFAYVTPTSDGGFDIATMSPSANGLGFDWLGNKWTSPGSSGVTYANTQFIPLDMDDDGDTDLDYVTSSNWSANGFGVALNVNNSGVFSWAGGQWAPTNLKLSQTTFIPQG